jgi:hypothetical protein
VFHNLEKPTRLSKEKDLFFFVAKYRFLRLFSAKIGPFATSSIYSEQYCVTNFFVIVAFG